MDDYSLIALAGGVEAAMDVAVARAASAPRGEASIHASCNREALEALGFEFLQDPAAALAGKIRRYGSASETDVHVRVRLPGGWTEGPSSDSRLRYFHDTRGVLRVETQYNGQFWDPYGYTTVVNLGYWAPTHLIYSDPPIGLDDIWWNELTGNERDAVVLGLRIAGAKDGAYKESAKRARDWLRTLKVRVWVRCQTCGGKLTYDQFDHTGRDWKHIRPSGQAYEADHEGEPS